MMVERSQEDDLITDNEELHGEDFDEDADHSDEDLEAQPMIGNRLEPVSEGPQDATIGTYGQNSCPPRSVAIDSVADCRSAATALGKNLVWTASFRRLPKGCIAKRNSKNVLYNKHARGRANGRWAVVCTQAASTTTPPPQVNCGWSRHAFQQCVGSVAGGSPFWGLADAQKKCSELGLSNCSAVTCRKTGQIETCTMRKCATLSHSGHGEVTYTPNTYPLGCDWKTYAFQKCANVAGAPFWGDLAEAKAKCLELGPCKCRAVTCRQFAFTICTIMPTCATLTRAGHGEKTYKPNC